MKKVTLQPAPTGKIEIRIHGRGRLEFDTAKATLLSQNEAELNSRGAATFLYRTSSGRYLSIRRYGPNDFESQELTEDHAADKWIRHQTGQTHVNFEEAFPGVEVVDLAAEEEELTADQAEELRSELRAELEANPDGLSLSEADIQEKV